MLVLMLPRVSSRVSGFPVASPCLWGKLQNVSFSKVSKQVVMSFCVAGAALCDIPTCLIPCRKLFCVARALLLRRFHQMSCSYRGRRSILEISVVILRGRRSTSDVSHCVHSTLYTPHSPRSPLYTPHFTLHTPTLYTPRFTLHTPHFTLHTLHSTLHTLHFTRHSTLYTPHFTIYTLHSTL